MRRQDGFTLIEILIAVAIGSLVLSAVYGVFASTSKARDRVEASSACFHQARVIFDRVGRELRGAYYRSGNAATRFAGGVEPQSGQPFVAFTTTVATPQGGLQGGIRLVRYDLAADTQRQGTSLALLRSEAPAFVGLPEGDQGYRMIAGIESMQWRFLSQDTWSDQWQTAAGTGLPQAVELTLQLSCGDAAIPFVSAFELPRLP